jgi:YesN/AraC family two-component response regulator
MVVDDHHMVRKGLAAYLKSDPDLVLVGEASNGEEALMLFEKVEPDVILMDLLMPKLMVLPLLERF